MTNRLAGWWRRNTERVRAYLAHPDPIAEASNDVAVLIGTHLPFWPLYLLWSAGLKTLPSSLFTLAMAPFFCLVPVLMRRNALLGRIATILVGTVNTLIDTWVLGIGSGTELFLLCCAALAAMSFRRSERWFMVPLALMPLVVWYGLRTTAPPGLVHYTAADDSALLTLNAVSVVVLFAAFGWLQSTIYQRMEKPAGSVTGLKSISE